MLRAIFCKTGNAVWISHLDLMRVLQRAFRRGGMMLKHSQGFTPHPHLSIAMPLSVGVSSEYELMDFALAEGDTTPIGEIKDRLNSSLPDGVRVLECYEDGRKLKELKYLRSELTLEYDAGVPQNTAEKINALFTQPSVIAQKHGKNGVTEVDLIPMLQSVTAVLTDDNTVTVACVGSAQNPTLNPLLLTDAISRELPDCKPDFSRCCRLQLLDDKLALFR